MRKHFNTGGNSLVMYQKPNPLKRDSYWFPGNGRFFEVWCNTRRNLQLPYFRSTFETQKHQFYFSGSNICLKGKDVYIKRNCKRFFLPIWIYFCAAPFVSSSSRRAPPKIKNIYYQDTKEKIKRFFHIWLVFVTRGLRLNSIKIFC